MTRKELLEAAEELSDALLKALYNEVSCIFFKMKAEGEEDAKLEAAYKAMNAVIRELED